MLHILFVLSYYRTTCMATSADYLTFYTQMSYGFNKNAKISLNISKITTQFVFGLATKKEMENIKAMESYFQYCDGKKILSENQYLIQNDTSLNFTIQKKNILTPFSILKLNLIYQMVKIILIIVITILI